MNNKAAKAFFNLKAFVVYMIAFILAYHYDLIITFLIISLVTWAKDIARDEYKNHLLKKKRIIRKNISDYQWKTHLKERYREN